MLDPSEVDDNDPMRCALRRYLLNLCVWGLIFLVLMVLAFVVGIPHLQGDYGYHGSRPPGGMTTAQQKTDAWYISLTGWKHVQSGQYGHEGCPYILFIPVKDCFD